MSSLSEIFSKKAQRQRTVEIMKMKDSHLGPLYEWCLTKFDEESHPFLPLALSLTYGRLLSSFLLRQAPASSRSTSATAAKQKDSTKNKKVKKEDKEGEKDDGQEEEKGSEKDDAKDGKCQMKEKEQDADKTAENEKTEVISLSDLDPSISEDPANSAEDRLGVLLRVEESAGKLPRLQLTARVAESLNGLVNDLMTVLKMIKDPTEDPLATTTVLEKARALLPKSDGEKSDIFGRLLVGEDNEAKRVKSEKLFCIFSGLTLGWTAEKVRRSIESYHDYVWLCDQVEVMDDMARRTAWKAAVLYKTVAQHQDAHQTYASRRYALLAACAALGLWQSSAITKKFEEETKEEGQDSKEEETEKGNDPPPTKRPRLSKSETDASTKAAQNMVQQLMEAAHKEAAYTRWIGGSSGRWKIAADLKADEIRQATLSLAHLLLATAEHEKKEQITPRVADHTTWWQALSQSLTNLPAPEEWECLVDDLYERQMKREEKNKTFSQNIQGFHEFAILEYERKSETADDRPTILLVDKVVWECPTGVDPRTSAVVSKGEGGEEADKIEKKILEPGVEAIKKRALMPTVYNEGMELNEWTVAILSIEDVEPTETLVAFLSKYIPGKKDLWKDMIPKIVNKSLLLLLQESLTAKVGRKASVNIDSDGKVSVTGELTHDKALCKGIVAFFFHSLESILSQETGSSAVDETFLRAVLTCCMTCVVQAAGMTHKIHPKVKDSPVYAFMQMTESTPMSFLHYAPLFRNSLTNPENESRFPLPKGLPRRVHREFLQAEMDVLDTVLWAKDPNFEDVLPDRVDDMIETTDKNCWWWPVKVLVDENEEGAEEIMYPSAKEDTYYLEIYHNLSVLMERALEVSHKRMEKVCRALGVAHWRLLLKYSWHTFRHLLRRHIKLFYDRHIDHWILTTIYGVGKRMKFNPEITFARTIEAYIEVRGPELGEAQCHRIVRQVKIKTSEGSSQLGHIILLYNKVFIPAMRLHLLKSEDLKEATKRLAKAVECRNSPLTLPQVTPSDPSIKEEPSADADMSTSD